MTDSLLTALAQGHITTTKTANTAKYKYSLLVLTKNDLSPHVMYMGCACHEGLVLPLHLWV